MVAAVRWAPAYRIIPSRYPPVGIFDDVADPADLEVVLELEAATNPRVLDEAGELSMVRPGDRVSGRDTTPIMAAFTHTRPSRFSDGSYGVYYAAHDEDTAIAETAHHAGRFLADAGLPNERLDMRVYTSTIVGKYDDIRTKPPRSKLYDPNSYVYSQTHARRLYEKNIIDGILYRSIRRRGGKCIAAFRATRVTRCKTLKHLEYRFSDYRLAAVIDISARAISGATAT